MNTSSFSPAAKILHWLVAGLIVSQYVLAKLAEKADMADQTLDHLALLANHKSVGMTILLLAMVRLAVRFISPPPPLPNDMPVWQQRTSHLSHILLYGFLFALPASGWLMSSAKAYSVSWFNVFAFPDLISPSEPSADLLHFAHHSLATALFVVALIHVLAALKHHVIDRDNILTRMSSGTGWVVFLLSMILTILFLGRFFISEVVDPDVLKSTNQPETSLASSDLPLWNIDYEDSFIRFSGDQAGAPFSGHWQRWQADIQFDPKQLSKARFNVSIDPNSVFSNDAERDEHIRSPDFFDIANFPKAYYRADVFNDDGGQYIAQGALSMKGISHPAPLGFSITDNNGRYTLSGQATLDRLLWNIGSGDWVDTSWVGQTVQVEVRVVAYLPNNGESK